MARLYLAYISPISISPIATPLLLTSALLAYISPISRLYLARREGMLRVLKKQPGFGFKHDSFKGTASSVMLMLWNPMLPT